MFYFLAIAHSRNDILGFALQSLCAMAASETGDGATAMDAACSDELQSNPMSPKPKSQPHWNAKATLDLKFWDACKDSRVPIASPIVGSIRHRYVPPCTIRYGTQELLSNRDSIYQLHHTKT